MNELCSNCYKDFSARLKTQEGNRGHTLAVEYIFGALFGGLITLTCKKDASYLVAQST